MDKSLTDALAVAAHYGMSDREVAVAVEAATAARRAEAERPGGVALVHPDLPGTTYLVEPAAVEVYERSGWVVAPAPDEPDDDGLPKGNASREEWAAYGARHGMTADDLEPLSRDEIRDHFQNDDEKDETP